MTTGEIFDAFLPAALNPFTERSQLLLRLIAAVKLVTLVEDLRQPTVAGHLRRRLAGIAWRRMTRSLARMGTPGGTRNGATCRARLTLRVFFV